MKAFSSLLIGLFAISTCMADGNPAKPVKSNYVVIGAFSHHENAVNFTEKAIQRHFRAEFAINNDRQLFYVYVLSTDDKEMAFNEAKKLRIETSYSDSWVYTGILGGLSSGKSEDIDPVTNSKIVEVEADKIAPKEVATENEPTEEMQTSEDVVSPSAPETQQQEEIDDPFSKRFFFNVYSASKKKQLEGSVDMIDLSKSKKIATYKGNSLIKVSLDSDAQVTWVCDVFGYRKQQKTIDLSVAEQYTIGNQGEYLVPFEMVRLRKGDIAVMYNVYFFNDAGIMRPESKYEVNSLLEMLQENPNYKIKIHGHANGNRAGKIIKMAKDGDNFFSLTGSTESFGSAKKLSEERAGIIREYLISQGIGPDRLVVKAWGGKRPVYDKNHPLAKNNVRVEIEIISE